MSTIRVGTVSIELINGRTAVTFIGLLFFVLATALGAYVRIPVKGSPVPITLQTFFVILSGAVLGRRLGGCSQFIYCVLGMTGLPVFQNFSFGASHLLGPTGGYLIGFIFASYAVGYMLESEPIALHRIAMSFVTGSLIIYGFGALWLVYLYKMSAASAISAGILPFIPGDMVKVVFAALIYFRISRRAKDIFSI